MSYDKWLSRKEDEYHGDYMDAEFFSDKEHKPIERSAYETAESYMESIVMMMSGQTEFDEEALLSYFECVVEDLEMNIDLKNFNAIKLKLKERAAA